MFKSQFDNYSRAQRSANVSPMPSLSISGDTKASIKKTLAPLLGIKNGTFFESMILNFSDIDEDKMDAYNNLHILVHEMLEPSSEDDTLNLRQLLHALQLDGNNEGSRAYDLIYSYLERLVAHDATLEPEARNVLETLYTQSQLEEETTNHAEFFGAQLKQKI